MQTGSTFTTTSTTVGKELPPQPMQAAPSLATGVPRALGSEPLFVPNAPPMLVSNDTTTSSALPFIGSNISSGFRAPPQPPPQAWFAQRSMFTPADSLWLQEGFGDVSRGMPLTSGIAPMSTTTTVASSGVQPMVMQAVSPLPINVTTTAATLPAQQPIPVLATATAPLQAPLILGKRWAVLFNDTAEARAAILWLGSVLDQQRRDEVQFIHIMERRSNIAGMPLFSDADSTRMKTRLREIQGAIDAECMLLKRFAPNTVFHTPIIVKPASTATHKKAMFDTLQEYRNRFDGVVLGTRSHAGAGPRFMMGSVGRKLLGDPFLPLVLVRSDSPFLTRLRTWPAFAQQQQQQLPMSMPLAAASSSSSGGAPGIQQTIVQSSGAQPLSTSSGLAPQLGGGLKVAENVSTMTTTSSTAPQAWSPQSGLGTGAYNAPLGNAPLGTGAYNAPLGNAPLGTGALNTQFAGGSFAQPMPHTWVVLLDGSDESRRAVQFVLPLVRNIDTLYFVNAIAGHGHAYSGRRPEIVDMNYPAGLNPAFANENDRQLHASKLALATAMSELNAGYAGRPAPRIFSNIYYGNSITNAIEGAIVGTSADTIVLGSRGLGQKRGLGSISSWALEHAHANVIIAPPTSLDHKELRHKAVRDRPYQKEKKTHRIFGRDPDTEFFA